MKIISIDPGVHTGIAVYNTTPWGRRIDSFTFGPADHHFDLMELFYKESPDEIVYEDFHYRNNKRRDGTKGNAVITSVEYIGIIKLYQAQQEFVHNRIMGIYRQEPMGNQPKKVLWDDEKLKVLNLYQAGEAYVHENDAIRHLLYHLTVTKRDTSWLERLKS